MAKFRLQKVLDVRRIVERQKEKELSVATMKLQREQNVMTSILARKHSFVAEMNLAGLDSVRRLAEYHGYLNTLLDQADRQQRVITAVAQQVELKRQHLLKATQDRKVLERLKEKREREWHIVETRKEQNFLDELARR